MRKRIFL